MANIMTRKTNSLQITNMNTKTLSFKDIVIKPHATVVIPNNYITDFLNSLSDNERENIIYTELL